MPCSEAQKRASKKWALANKDKINETTAKRMKNKYNNDDEYREQKKLEMKAYRDKHDKRR